MADDKQAIKSTDKDFEDYWVRIHGSPIGNVLSADTLKGEVWVHDGLDVTKPFHLKTGTVTITRKREVEPQAPASETKAPKSKSTGQKPTSARSTSGA